MTLGKAVPSSQWGSGIPLWHNSYWRQRCFFWRANGQCVCVCWCTGKNSCDQLFIWIRTQDVLDFRPVYPNMISIGWWELVFCSEVSLIEVCFMGFQVDRSPTGSGVTARIALQYHKGLIGLNQTRSFKSGATGSVFTGKAIEVPLENINHLRVWKCSLCSWVIVAGLLLKETMCGDFRAVVVEVTGHAHYSGVASFTQENDDPLSGGFLLRWLSGLEGTEIPASNRR